MTEMMSSEEQAIELMTSEQRLSGRTEALRLLVELRHAWGREIANLQRNVHDELRPHFHAGQPCQPRYDCHVSKVIDVATGEWAEAVK